MPDGDVVPVIVAHLLRLGLTVGLLYVVWGHSHWSVALTLTLVMLEIELRNLNEWLKKRR